MSYMKVGYHGLQYPEKGVRMKQFRTLPTLLMAAALLIAAIPTGNVLAEADTLGPITSGVAVAPNPATINTPVTVTATVDDTTTGGSNIQSAEYSLNGGTWSMMSATDGAFDTVMENVTATFTVTQTGSTEVCVRGTDAAGNVGESACTTLTTQYQFTFTGFRWPIRMGQDNRVNAPRAIPVKWKLTLTDGTPVSDPSSFVALKSYQVDCTTLLGDPSTAVMGTTPGNAGLRYLGAGNWIFRWKTTRDYRHTCRLMFVEFSGGQMSPTVLFRFR
jgi:hypothetical protein